METSRHVSTCGKYAATPSAGRAPQRPKTCDNRKHFDDARGEAVNRGKQSADARWQAVDGGKQSADAHRHTGALTSASYYPF